MRGNKEENKKTRKIDRREREREREREGGRRKINSSNPSDAFYSHDKFEGVQNSEWNESNFEIFETLENLRYYF